MIELFKNIDENKSELIINLSQNGNQIEYFTDFINKKKEEFRINNFSTPDIYFKEYEKLLKIFSTGYIKYSINHDIFKNLKKVLEKKNEDLEELNGLLFDVVNDLIKMNYDFFQMDSLNQLEVTNDKLLSNIKFLKKSMGKVAKFVTKKNLNIIKNLLPELKQPFSMDRRRSSVNKDKSIKRSIIELNHINLKNEYNSNSPNLKRKRVYSDQIKEIKLDIQNYDNKLRKTEIKINKIFSFHEHVKESQGNFQYESVKIDLNDKINNQKVSVRNDLINKITNEKRLYFINLSDNQNDIQKLLSNFLSTATATR